MGPKGEKGDQGEPGEMGPQGPPGECECPAAYVGLWSQTAQTQTMYGGLSDAVRFEGVNASLDFDTSMINITGALKILTTGAYFITWSCNGSLKPPFPAPVPSWAYSLFVNDVFVPGASGLGFTSSPNDELAHTNGNATINLVAGDVIKLKNITMSDVNLVSIVPSLAFPGTSASLSALLID